MNMAMMSVTMVVIVPLAVVRWPMPDQSSTMVTPGASVGSSARYTLGASPSSPPSPTAVTNIHSPPSDPVQ